jgi:superfamily II DNA or RNA helicase/intein/homing endonuclease
MKIQENKKNKTYLSKRGYGLLKSEFNYDVLNKIKKELTVSPNLSMTSGIGFSSNNIPTYYLYKESEKKLYIPPYYGIKKFGIPDVNNLKEGVDINIKFNGTLRENQVLPVKKIMKALRDPLKNGGLINARCAFGKTAVSLYIIAELGKKAMVVVHKNFLLDQWKERIAQFLPDAKIGIIKAQTFDIENKDIVLASLQSLSMKDYDPSSFEEFGCIVVDECLPGNQYISTENGQIKIEDLYNNWKNNLLNPLVRSYNNEIKDFEFKEISYAFKKNNKYEYLLKITFFDNNFVLECTPNHKILTINGMKESCFLIRNDIIISYYNPINYLIIKHIYKIPYKQKVYDIEVKDNHNFVCCTQNSPYGAVVSNCHHIASEVFSKALVKTNFKYSLGLSATITRKDGLSKVFKWYLGDICYRDNKISNDNVNVHIYKYYSSSILYSSTPTLYNGKLNIPRMINNICEFKPRDELIRDIVLKIKKEEPQRNILILSDRRQHLKNLYLLLSENKKEYIHNIGFYVGGMKQEQLKKTEDESDVILGTFHISCIDENTWINNPITGDDFQMKDFQNKTKNIITYDISQNNFNITHNSDFGYSIHKPCIKIKHKAGNIIVSNDHKLYTQDGWKKADQLKITDYLISPASLILNEVDNPELSYDDLWSIGSYIGYFNKEVIKDIDINIINKYILNDTRLHPSIIYLPLNKICILLGALFDTCGLFYNNINYINMQVLTSEIKNQVKTLFLRLGIICSTYVSFKSQIKKYYINPSIDGYKYIFDNISIYSRFKGEILRNYIAHEFKSNMCTWRSSIPTSIIKENISFNVNLKEYLNNYKYPYKWLFNDNGCPIYIYKKMVDDGIITKNLDKFRYVPINDFEHIEKGKINLCDISVSHTHNFLVSDIIIHNSEGLDIPKLDTIILASPKTSIEQSVGRILRKKPENRINIPLIIDIFDYFANFINQGNKRNKFYSKKNYNISIFDKIQKDNFGNSIDFKTNDDKLQDISNGINGCIIYDEDEDL